MEIKTAEVVTPKGIIKQLNLLKPIYSETAKWGHFGNGFNWDK
jgi:S-adenosylmethionine synthetase